MKATLRRQLKTPNKNLAAYSRGNIQGRLGEPPWEARENRLPQATFADFLIPDCKNPSSAAWLGIAFNQIQKMLKFQKSQNRGRVGWDGTRTGSKPFQTGSENFRKTIIPARWTPNYIYMYTYIEAAYIYVHIYQSTRITEFATRGFSIDTVSRSFKLGLPKRS